MEALQAGAVQLPHRALLHVSTRSNCSLVKRSNLAVLALPHTSTFLSSQTSRRPVSAHISSHTQTKIQRETPESPTPTPTPTPARSPSRTPTPTPTRTSSQTRTKIHPWLIVGIGNPGNKFHKTRHNVGFEIIDAIAEIEGIKLNTIQQKALTGKGEIGPTQVLLAKPQTYVNLTGQSVGPLAAYYRIPVQQILVIYDDTTLEFGLMRLATKAGHGGHNGVKSVIENLHGCRLFPRLRIGIGSPPGTMDPGAFVLQKFAEDEREEIDTLVSRAPILIREMITKGIEKTAEAWNEVRKSRMQLTDEELEMLRRI